MNKKALVKVLGLVCSVGTIILTLAQNWVEDQQLEEKVNDLIDKRLAEKEASDEV